MTLYSDTILGIGCGQPGGCSADDGCPDNVKPDFCIKRNDTTPSFKVAMEDCDGVVDLSKNHVLEVNIWVKSKLKRSIEATDTEISFADNIGFNQVKENNVILMNRARNPEKMLITGFDEDAKTITVTRGYDSTTAQSWSKGSDLRVFRALNVEGEIESVYEDVTSVDGTTTNELVQTFLTYAFTEETSCLAGCYWLEFKLTQINDNLDVISTRRLPAEGEAFLIRVVDSPTES